MNPQHEATLLALERAQFSDASEAFEQTLTTLAALDPDARAHPWARALEGYARWRLDDEIAGQQALEQAAASAHARGAMLACVRLAHVSLHGGELERGLAWLDQVAPRLPEWPELHAHAGLMEGRLRAKALQPGDEVARERLVAVLSGAAQRFEVLGDHRRSVWSMLLMARACEGALSAPHAARAEALLHAPQARWCWASARDALKLAAWCGQIAQALEVARPWQGEVGDEAYASALCDALEERLFDALAPLALLCEEGLRVSPGGELEAYLCYLLMDAQSAYGDYAQMTTLARRALRQRGLSQELRLRVKVTLATALFDQGETAQAAALMPTQDELAGLDAPRFEAERSFMEGLIWARRGALERGLHHLIEAVELSVASESPLLTMHALVNAANIFLDLDALDEADELVTMARELVTASARPQDRAQLAWLVGRVALARGEHAQALEALREARLAHPHPASREIIAICEGQALLERGDVAQARASFEALAQGDIALTRMFALCELGHLDAPAAPDAAARWFARAAQEAARIGAVMFEADALLWYSQHQADPCDSLHRALQLVLALSTFIPSERARHELLARAQHIGATLMLAQLETGDVYGALTTLYEVKAGDWLRQCYERARQRSAMEAVSLPASASLREVPPLTHPAMHGHTMSGAGARLLEHYMQLVRDQPVASAPLADPEQVLACLAPGEVVLEYLLIEAADALRVHVFALREGQVQHRAWALEPWFDEALSATLARLSGARGARSTVHARALARGLERLGQALWAPITGLIAGATRVLISPGAALREVPFHALCDEAGVFAWQTHHIDYLISSGQLIWSAPQARLAEVVLWRPEQPELAPLPELDEELDWVEAHWRARGARVRRVSQWDEAIMREADLIHYGGHASFGEEDAPSARALDALGMTRLPRRPLVVLSACETGRVEARGEELVGVLRGAFASGARAVISASWGAHDAMTTRLMRGLYEQLEVAGEEGAALRRASLAMRAERGPGAHPFYWANFRCFVGASILAGEA